MDKSGPKSKNPEPGNQGNDEKKSKKGLRLLARADYAFVPVASNVLQFKCMACVAKITAYSLEGSEKLLQLVSNYSMVSNFKR
ncbi:hypothetical protein ERO13_D11G258866v2 [Gossypium hirsutum]|uniref:Uncharacterized protein n=1 Tax=Gossypium tomentosum TaxID=34277 RepID=A0A5D2IV19_GOSTO|nr:hypothetical protein ERO13_D11G258866v2 [Gossypium hirsutum]TYH45919.1 hypothetical protein ES332_D11G299100v1 [Gossypium tomentosum]